MSISPTTILFVKILYVVVNRFFRNLSYPATMTKSELTFQIIQVYHNSPLIKSQSSANISVHEGT